MKRSIVYIIAIFIGAGSLAAQEKRYEHELNLVAGIGMNTDSGFTLQYVFRANMGKYFSAGAGMNLDWYYTDGMAPTHVPVYFSFKLRMPEKKVSPYMVGDIGYILDGDSRGESLYFSPGLGINVKTKKSVKLNFGLGLMFNRIQYPLNRIAENIFLMKFGFIF